MMRRNSQLPWNSQRSGAIYGGGGRGNGRLFVLAAIVVGVVVVGWFVYRSAFGTEECTKPYCATGKSITIPEGYERVTAIFEYRGKQAVPAGSDVKVSLPLSKPTTDGRNLSFYGYDPDSKSWSPITPALLDPQGRQVQATLASTPAVLAVLKRLLPAGHVIAYVGHNARMHQDAVGRVTILHTRDFKPTTDGTLAGELTTVRNDPAPGDRAPVAWYPTVSVDATDKASIPVMTAILSSSASRTNHVQQIVKKVVDSQLAGIDIAYFDLRVEDRTAFTLFVTELANGLHAQNKVLTLLLPAPQKSPERVDEGAYDWAELGKAADILQIAPYRDQGTYRLVMPEILQYLTKIVEPSKLVLTVSPYATEKSAEGAFQPMPLTQAMTIATKMGARGTLTTSAVVAIAGTNIDQETENLSGVRWSPEAACVAFTYKSNGARTVWIENFFSIGFKLEFIPRFKLGGVAVEDASGEIALGNIWPALIPFITSGQPVLLQPNPKDLAPVWDSAGKGTLEGGQRGVVKWSTPAEPGNYVISLTLSDGVAQFRNEIPVTVQAKAATGTPGPTPGTR